MHCLLALLACNSYSYGYSYKLPAQNMSKIQAFVKPRWGESHRVPLPNEA